MRDRLRVRKRRRQQQLQPSVRPRPRRHRGRHRRRRAWSETCRSKTNLDWYQVSFPTPLRPGEGTPSIGFAVNTEEQFVFDVLTAQCGAGGMPCGNAGAPEGIAEGLTDFSFVDDDDAGCCTEPMDALVEWPELVYIRVYRTTPGSSCAVYQLEVSR